MTSAYKFPEPGSGGDLPTPEGDAETAPYQLKFGGIVTIKAAAAIATP